MLQRSISRFFLIYKRRSGKRVAICSFRFSVLDLCLNPVSRPLAAFIRPVYFPLFPSLSSTVSISLPFLSLFPNCRQPYFAVRVIVTACFDMPPKFFRTSNSPLHLICFVFNCSLFVSHLH